MKETTMNSIVNLKEKFTLFNEYWTPKIVGEVNNFHVKIFKAKGEFVWHSHKNDDEFFLIIKGQLTIKLHDQDVTLNEGEFFIVPKGVEHMPYAQEEVHVLLLEPKTVVNTGEVTSDKTARDLEWL